MYPIFFEDLLKNQKILKTPLLFLSCVSFEERCLRAAHILSDNKGLDVDWSFFQIRDNESEYEKECLKLQKENELDLRKYIHLSSSDDIPCYDLFNPAKTVSESLKGLFKESINKKDYKTIFLDLTTIPKFCFIPFLKWLLNFGLGNRELIILYTTPKGYGGELEREMSSPSVLINDIDEDEKDILWIPSLGFHPDFTFCVWEQIKTLGNIGKDIGIEIMPLVGFPAFRPDYFDKSIISHTLKFEDVSKFNWSLKKEVIFGSADDPFEIYEKLSKVIENYKENKRIILSPLSAKPISLGISLAAIKYNLPILTVQAKSYSPTYSEGFDKCISYWIKKNGEYTYL